MLTLDYEIVSSGEKDTVVVKPVSPYNTTTKKKRKAKLPQGVSIQFFDEKEFHELKDLEKSVRASLLVEQFKKTREEQRRQSFIRFIRLLASHSSQYDIRRNESIHMAIDHNESVVK